MKNTAVLVLSLSLAGGTLVAQDATVKSLLSKDLAGIPGKELSMITVEYPPGGSDTVHRQRGEWKSAGGGKREHNRDGVRYAESDVLARIPPAEYYVCRSQRPGGVFRSVRWRRACRTQTGAISSLLHRHPRSGRLKEV